MHGRESREGLEVRGCDEVVGSADACHVRWRFAPALASRLYFSSGEAGSHGSHSNFTPVDQSTCLGMAQFARGKP